MMRARTMRRAQDRVTYQTVESVARRRLGCRSDGAAHQRLLSLRRQFAEAVSAFIEAGAPERLTWFLKPTDDALSTVPVQPVGEALLAEEQADGDEDIAKEMYRRNPSPALMRQWRRTIYRHIARLQMLARALEDEPCTGA